VGGSLWIVFTLIGAVGQVARNSLQKELVATLGTIGATHVRFLFGLPFGLIFLLLVCFAKTRAPAIPNATMLAWTMLGALTQIGGTALLLAAMRERSFVVATALVKTEPIHVALFGLAVLGDPLTVGLAAAIAIATAGVMTMSWPSHAASQLISWRPIVCGLGSGALFAAASVGIRASILAQNEPDFVLAATTTLALSLFIQTAVLTTYLLLRDRSVLVSIFAAWRPSISAGFIGAFASEMWFLAFALESAAKVRTLALVEILLAQALTLRLFQQRTTLRDLVGIALTIAGVALLLNL
jgi:drug/metabolite transporter (DMT)-like permease